MFAFHGQWEGKKNQLEVHLRRSADENVNFEVQNHYIKLNQVLLEPAFRSSNYYYIDNIYGEKKDDFVAYIREEDDNHFLIVVNYFVPTNILKYPYRQNYHLLLFEIFLF